MPGGVQVLLDPVDDVLASSPYFGRMPARAPSRAALVTTFISRNMNPKSMMPTTIRSRSGSTRRHLDELSTALIRKRRREYTQWRHKVITVPTKMGIA